MNILDALWLADPKKSSAEVMLGEVPLTPTVMAPEGGDDWGIARDRRQMARRERTVGKIMVGVIRSYVRNQAVIIKPDFIGGAVSLVRGVCTVA